MNLFAWYPRAAGGIQALGICAALLWTSPCAAAEATGRGTSPAQNAVGVQGPIGCLADPRKIQRLLITRPGIYENYLMHGWNQPGQISLMAAVNAKENVEVRIENCVFRDNEVCFRLRGPGSRGGALVMIRNCAVYDSKVGVRMEDGIRDLKIERLGFLGLTTAVATETGPTAAAHS